MKIANQEEHNQALNRVSEIKKELGGFSTNLGSLNDEVTLLEEEKKEKVDEYDKKSKPQKIKSKRSKTNKNKRLSR